MIASTMCETMRQLEAKFPNQSELARLMGVTPQAVQRWFRQGYVPANRALQIAGISGIPVVAFLPQKSDGKSKQRACPMCAAKRKSSKRISR